jgi:hypothetical protein
LETFQFGTVHNDLEEVESGSFFAFQRNGLHFGLVLTRDGRSSFPSVLLLQPGHPMSGEPGVLLGHQLGQLPLFVFSNPVVVPDLVALTLDRSPVLLAGMLISINNSYAVCGGLEHQHDIQAFSVNTGERVNPYAVGSGAMFHSWRIVQAGHDGKDVTICTISAKSDGGGRAT